MNSIIAWLLGGSAGAAILTALIASLKKQGAAEERAKLAVERADKERKVGNVLAERSDPADTKGSLNNGSF